MAIYYRPKDPMDSISASLGGSMGKGLGEILDFMTKEKLKSHQEKKRGNKIANMMALLGAPPEYAEALSTLPPEQQDLLFQQFAGSEALPEGVAALGQGQQQPQQQQEDISQLIQQGQVSPDQQQVVPQDGVPQDGAQPVDEQLPQDQELSFKEKLNPEITKQLRKLDEKQEKELMKEANFAGASPEDKRLLRRAMVPNTANQAIKQSTLQQKPTAKKSFAELLATPRPSKKDKEKAARDIQKMDLAERKFKFKKQQVIDKDTKKDYDKILSSYKSSVENDWRLNKLDKLIDTGDLAGPATMGILKAAGKMAFGVDLTSIAGANTEEFGKLYKDFLREAKQHFGSRMTQRELELYMETIPNLLQSDEGKKRVIRNMQLFNKSAKLRYDAMQEMIGMNGDRPKNMAALIERKIKPEMDVIGKEFAKNVDFGAKQASKATTKWATRAIGTGMGLTALAGAGIGLSGLGKVLGMLKK